MSVARRSPVLRVLAGVAISVILLAVVVVRVDLAVAGATIAAAAPLGLLTAIAIVLVDLALRALRWHVLLGGVAGVEHRPRYRLALGYLAIGFTANAVLPARLGDVARAVLAGTAFRASRLAIFGTILIERVSDGLTMLALAAASSVLVAGIAETRELAVFGVAAVAAGAALAIAGWLVVSRSPLARTRTASLATRYGERVLAGAGTLRTMRGAVAVVGLTAVVAGTAMLVAWSISEAVGASLGPAEVVLFTSGIALSLAIPAAPGALGTYEFVGVAIFTGLGYSAEQGLATILLMRIVSTFPPALSGLVALFVLHVRPREIVDASEEDPARRIDPRPAELPGSTR